MWYELEKAVLLFQFEINEAVDRKYKAKIYGQNLCHVFVVVVSWAIVFIDYLVSVEIYLRERVNIDDDCVLSGKMV